VKLYNLFVPKQIRLPVVADLPHSGTYVPPNIVKQFRRDPRVILPNMDWHLDKLYDFLPELGITVLQATHSRYVVNLNRGLQPPLFGPEKSSVISKQNTLGNALYNRELNQSEIEERITRYYTPYHERLKQIIKKIIRDFSRVYLFDLHSFFTGPSADVCLGNVNGTTCSERLIGCFETALRKHDFSVTRNEVWIGGYITRHYGNMDNVESLQIEIRFPAYLDGQDFNEEEIKEWDSDKFRSAKKRLRKVFSYVLEELFGSSTLPGENHPG
jgi:N-formylglutamate deformylase